MAQRPDTTLPTSGEFSIWLPGSQNTSRPSQPGRSSLQTLAQPGWSTPPDKPGGAIAVCREFPAGAVAAQTAGLQASAPPAFMWRCTWCQWGPAPIFSVYVLQGAWRDGVLYGPVRVTWVRRASRTAASWQPKWPGGAPLC